MIIFGHSGCDDNAPFEPSECPAITPALCQTGATTGECVNLKTNAANCDSCGTACPMGQSCVDGVCT